VITHKCNSTRRGYTYFLQATTIGYSKVATIRTIFYITSGGNKAPVPIEDKSEKPTCFVVHRDIELKYITIP
jgi:hypothetical protein